MVLSEKCPGINDLSSELLIDRIATVGLIEYQPGQRRKDLEPERSGSR
jgi:hypothetical protein